MNRTFHIRIFTALVLTFLITIHKKKLATEIYILYVQQKEADCAKYSEDGGKKKFKIYSNDSKNERKYYKYPPVSLYIHHYNH